MEPQTQRANLYAPLPTTDPKNPTTDHTKNIPSLLELTLPASEQKTIEQQLQWHFPLEKPQSTTVKKRTRPKKNRKRRQATRKRNREASVISPDEGVHELEKPGGGWCYAALLPVRDMWRDYMRRCIGKPGENSSLRLILGKCEFIGADVTVEKSTIVSMVGLNGIIVRETQKLFEIVTKNSEYKKIPKLTTILCLTVGAMEITLIGKHFMTRPAERSVKKIKSLMFADI